jgi:hypothetical protein
MHNSYARIHKQIHRLYVKGVDVFKTELLRKRLIYSHETLIF